MRNRLPWMLVVLVSLTACSGAPIEHVTGRRFIAVGNNGGVVESRDGTNWRKVYTTSASNFRSIAYGADVFVLVGNGGTIYTSVDGVLFKPRSSPSEIDLIHVIYTGERFVAVGGDFKLGAVAITSTNGIDWESLSAPSTFFSTRSRTRMARSWPQVTRSRICKPRRFLRQCPDNLGKKASVPIFGMM